jgi:hypothetical protein
MRSTPVGQENGIGPSKWSSLSWQAEILSRGARLRPVERNDAAPAANAGRRR